MDSKAPCKYFGKCGGCQFQNIENYADLKYADLKEKLTKLNSDLTLHKLFQVNDFSRRRVNFKVFNNALAFSYRGTNRLIEINECLVADAELNCLIKPINNLLKRFRSKIKEVFITKADIGIEIVFNALNRSCLEDEERITQFAKENKIARIAWQIKDFSPIVMVHLSPFQLHYEDWKINLPIKCFQQVTKDSLDYMTSLISRLLDKSSKTIEFFSGVGSFSLPIYSVLEKLTSVEGNGEAVNSLRETAIKYNLKIEVVERDLFNNPFISSELKDFQQVVINPPRNGASPQVKEISDSESIKKVVMISCSVDNFVRDAKILLSKGFRLADVFPVDQFLYSNHLELVANFIKK